MDVSIIIIIWITGAIVSYILGRFYWREECKREHQKYTWEAVLTLLALSIILSWIATLTFIIMIIVEWANRQNNEPPKWL